MPQHHQPHVRNMFGTTVFALVCLYGCDIVVLNDAMTMKFKRMKLMKVFYSYVVHSSILCTFLNVDLHGVPVARSSDFKYVFSYLIFEACGPPIFFGNVTLV